MRSILNSSSAGIIADNSISRVFESYDLKRFGFRGEGRFGGFYQRDRGRDEGACIVAGRRDVILIDLHWIYCSILNGGYDEKSMMKWSYG